MMIMILSESGTIEECLKWKVLGNWLWIWLVKSLKSKPSLSLSTMTTSVIFQLNFLPLLSQLAARVIGKFELLVHLPVAAHLSSSCRWILWQTSTPLCTLEKCICHLQCALITRKITTLVWWPTNRAQIHANIGAIAVSAAARSACRMRKECHKSVEFGSAELVLFLFSFCIILSVPVFSFIRHIPSCHLLSSISSGFTVTISVSVSVTGNLLGCPTMRWSGCLAVWQSDNLTVLTAWLSCNAGCLIMCASCCLQLAASSAHKSPFK